MSFNKTLLFGILFLLSLSAASMAEGKAERPIVFAASSLTSVLTEQSAIWSRASNMPMPRLSFGASATMARQIQAGAPAHIFISANPCWAEMLKKSGHAENLIDLASNQLVLVKPTNNRDTPTFTATPAYFEKLLHGRSLAIADPQLAPAGAYAVTFLRRSSLWATLQNQIAYGQNARQTLRLAEQGGLPAFVYKSDALMSEKVTILYNVPRELSGEIVYQAALLNRAGPVSRAFLEFLNSTDANAVWKQHGFNKLPQNGTVPAVPF